MNKKILYFTATYCGPCKSFGPIMENISQEISIQKIDVDSNPELTKQFGIRNVPSLIITDDNNSILGRKIGIMSEEQVKNWYNSI